MCSFCADVHVFHWPSTSLSGMPDIAIIATASWTELLSTTARCGRNPIELKGSTMPRSPIMTPKRTSIAPTAKLKAGDSGPEVNKLYEYLKRFGYFPNERLAKQPFWRPAMPFAPKDPSRFDDRMAEAVRLFQRAQSLPIDGTLNQATLDLMAKPGPLVHGLRARLQRVLRRRRHAQPC